MARDVVSVKLVGAKTLQKRIREIDPGQNPKISSKALVEMAQTVARNAARVQIRPGGGPPRPSFLIGRTGTLQRSLGLSSSINRTGLPNRIEVGTALVYGAVWEATPRKFLAPALAEEQLGFVDIYQKHWRREAGL